jgi:beta-mannosidase
VDGDGVVLAGWSCTATAPGLITAPGELSRHDLSWTPASIPGTAAGALLDAGRWTPAEDRSFDAEDWWFRCRFPRPAAGSGPWELAFGGLATLADVWLDGRHVLRSENMFRSHVVDLPGDRSPAERSPDAELVIRFEALGPHLARRHPRPGWKAAMVTSQNLRWYRTSFIGRTATSTPPVAPVGPWRPIELRRRSALPILRRTIALDHDGADGRIRLALTVDPGGSAVRTAELVAAGHRSGLTIETSDEHTTLTGELTVPGAPAWWPATHGEQPRVPVSVTIRTGDGEHTVDLGPVGFRSVSFGPDDTPQVTLNGAPIFCRGVVWTTLDLVRLSSSRAELRSALRALRDGGVNLVRIPGTMVYEPPEFLDLCDELGILVWQDLMFANLDYPMDDPGFAAEVDAEVVAHLSALQGHACVVAVCGGSEISQQAAMLSRPREQVAAAPLGKVLQDRAAELLPGIRCWPDSPTGGDSPFTVDTGVAHYFGVGGYRRPLSDARTSNVRFASECLALSAVPDDDAVLALRAAGVVVGDPRWKAGVPRDAARAWDHEDVRDHYIRAQFGVDPATVRATDPDRYLDLGRAAAADLVAATVSEWRRPGSTCGGAVVLQTRDATEGAGTGLFDVHGRPKSTWRALARSSSPVALLFIDEGLNGLDLHACNDGPAPVGDTLVLRAFAGPRCTAMVQVPCTVPARSTERFRVQALLGEFLDLTYAFRFGPCEIDGVSARWSTEDDLVARAVYRPTAAEGAPQHLGLAGTCRPVDGQEDGHPFEYELDITTERLARCILIGASGAQLSDDAFDLEPGGHALIRARCSRPSRFHVRAVNGLDRTVLAATGA